MINLPYGPITYSSEWRMQHEPSAISSNPCRNSSVPYWKAACNNISENMLILHDDDFCPQLLAQYQDVPYFRLKHDLNNLTQPSIPEGYTVCRPSIKEFADHMNRCYDSIGVTATELQSYTARPVYCPELWIAVQDNQTKEIAATGIAELDQELREGMLEWIQVSQCHRRRGLGIYVVRELLWRMKGKAHFATVSGQCENHTNPEHMYRKCGFSGNDLWHVLYKRQQSLP